MCKGVQPGWQGDGQKTGWAPWILSRLQGEGHEYWSTPNSAPPTPVGAAEGLHLRSRSPLHRVFLRTGVGPVQNRTGGWVRLLLL